MIQKDSAGGLCLWHLMGEGEQTHTVRVEISGSAIASDPHLDPEMPAQVSDAIKSWGASIIDERLHDPPHRIVIGTSSYLVDPPEPD